jgi:hypothetical protein
VSIYAPTKGGRGRELRAFSRPLAEFFAAHLGRTRRDKSIPVQYLTMPKRQSRAFLSGLMDSDGYFRGGRFEYVCKSKELAAQVYKVIINAGYAPCLTTQSKGHFIVAYSKVPLDQTRVGQITDLRFRCPKKVGGARERVYDLTVSDGESFIVGGFAVHNCHRIGQRDSVFVQYLVFSGSLDQTVLASCLRKREVTSQLRQT